MSRDASGTYTAPSNTFNPAVEGTPIDEADWNSTLDDLEAALTDSVSRTGKGTVSAHIDFDENASPGTPAANVIRLHAYDSGGTTKLATKDSAGTVTPLNLVVGTDVQAYDSALHSNIPQNSQSAAYTTVLGDAQKHILHPSADTTARVFTINSNANVAYPVGTAITFINQNGAGTITIAITADTMRLAGAGTTGSRTLAANGIATAIKITTTEWIISGTNLT